MDERPQICYGCMTMQSAPVCPKCGYVRDTKTAPVYLRPGTMLQDKYLIGKVIGHGGFGITYLALDTVLGVKLAVKEYFVGDYATRTPDGQVTAYESDKQARFEAGIRRFLEEARILARFEGNPGIVSVRDFFRANGTAYLVMTYLEGMNLRQYLAKNGPMPFERVRDELLPVLTGALSAVHAAGMLHRDVSPDNIFMTDQGQAKIIDFGAARQLAGDDQSLSIILKPGYAPEEQYRSRGHQGPWTDVYAVAATLYRAITGKVPAEALDRLQADILTPPSRYCEIGPAQEAVLLRAMSVYAKDRYPTMQAFCDAMMAAKQTDLQDEVTTRERESEPRPTVQMSPEEMDWQEWDAPEEPPQQRTPERRNAPRGARRRKQAPVEEIAQEREPDEMEEPVSREGVRLGAAMGGAVKVIVALIIILLVLSGGYLLIRSLLNSLAQSVPPILDTTATPGPTPGITGEWLGGSEATTGPGETFAPNETPDLATEEPEESPTPTPVPTAFPQPPEVQVNTSGASGPYYSDVTGFAPSPNMQYVYASGETVGNLIYRTGIPEEGDVLVARFITDASSLKTGTVEIYFKRDGALYCYDQNTGATRLVLPANVQAGVAWTQNGVSYEVVALGQTVSVRGNDYADCLVVHQISGGQSRDLLYQQGVGLVAEVDDYLSPDKAYLRLRFSNPENNTAAATELCTDAPLFNDGSAAQSGQ